MTLKTFLRSLRALVHPGAADRELEEEIRYHIERETEQLVRAGVEPREARRRARVAFDGVENAKETYRDGRGDRWLQDFVGDTRYALRTLRRNRTLAAAAIVTLALGIGASTAIFSAVNGVILRPLPFPEPERLAMVWEDNPEKGWVKQVAAPANYLDWRQQVKAFADAAAWTDGRHATTMTGRGGAQLLRVTEVTGNFFSVLRVPAMLGRTFAFGETWKGNGSLAVVSYRTWRDKLGADPSVVGKSVELDGRPVQIVGVMPNGFTFPSPEVDAWVPLGWDPAFRSQIWFRRAHWLRVVARVANGRTMEAANAELQTVARRLQTQFPETNTTMFAGMGPLQDFLVGSTRTPLLVLLGATAFLLLIACANVANLMLVRAAAREREIVLRRALGAGDVRVIRQTLTESLVLSAIGGAAGLAVGWYGTRVLVALQPKGLFNAEDVRADSRVFFFVLAVTVLSGILFGVGPAIWNRRRVPAAALREGTRGAAGSPRLRAWGNALVVAEVAVALVLSIGAGLLARSFWRLTSESPGFDPKGVFVASLYVPDVRYDTPEKVLPFYRDLLTRTRALPGVESAALVLVPPLAGTGSSWTSDFSVAGRAPDQFGREVTHRDVSPDYFRTMRVPLIAGRDFTEADVATSTPVIIINQSLARQYFADENPLGQRIAFDREPDSTSTWRTIVGVVGDEHQETLALQPRIEIFEPHAQGARPAMTLVARTGGDPHALAGAIRAIVSQLDPSLTLLSTRTMEEVRDGSLARERFFALLLFAFAAVGLALAVVGVYGVMAQLALRRTREMGIRIALGAGSGQVRWLIVRHGLGLLAVGVAMGLGVAAMVTTAMEKLLFHVPARDLLTFGTTALLLLLTGVLASWVPATRATRADPAGTLRAD